jgi:hypothetical protein
VKSTSQKFALVPLTERDAAEQLLVYETTAAKMLKISIHDFRNLVNDHVIPYRLHRGRSKRVYFIDDLRAYVRSLDPHYGNKATGCAVREEAFARDCD